ncbi:MAG: leucine-rich repeat protein [Clostridia bacterium]|nr:leucine-rich repeat protein [Clostridia bacterium]
MHQTNRIIPRIAAMVLVVLLVAAHGVLPISAAGTSGKCGKNLTWSFSAGTLKIEGSGDMYDYKAPENVPWSHLSSKIIKVQLPADLKSIGDMAFYHFENITTFVIPDSVTEIGIYAFAGCKSLVMVDMGSRVAHIGEGAFRECTALCDIRMPYSIVSVGTEAFYRCKALKSIKFHNSLETLGAAVFQYCDSLVSAEFGGMIGSIPEWTFYGCDSLMYVSIPDTVKTSENYAFKGCDLLTSVYYEGKADLGSQIAGDLTGFDSYGFVGSGSIPDDRISVDHTVADDGSEEFESIKTKVNDNMSASVVTKVEETPTNSADKGSYTADIKVVVESDDGFDGAKNYVNDILKELSEVYSVDYEYHGIYLTIYLKNGVTLPKSFLETFVGRELYITFVSADGSSWTVYCKDIDLASLTDKLNYSYDVAVADKTVTDKLGTTNSYVISFKDSAELNSEVKIRLPDSSAANTNAFLYQINEDGEHERIQAVRVDSEGVAHFYLANVDKDTKYVVGVNVPGEKTDDVIFYEDPVNPNALAIQRLEKIEYEVTGVKSSWGLSFWQVTIILVVSLVFVIIVVGVTASFINKRKHRRNAENQKLKAGK